MVGLFRPATFVLVLILFFSGSGAALAKDFILCSPVDGRLVSEDGAPVSGADVTRAWTWGKKTGADTVTTDASGGFSFGTVTGRSFLASLLPHEPVVEQVFTAVADGSATTILTLYKHDYNLNGELDGAPLRMECTAGAEPAAGGFFYGTCRPMGD
ncbi:DUF6795 domain-containing protein [Tropicimonas sp. IMCC34011]|uniref:DUF6795 domain-containing protein n=1 Tax=Tropicimonas sp. IMCC34011 TaxID=2248759 RepID=UPI000E22D2FB|nr:DUF6795 domain-containing protein [Tropicimonas sp. IMCC34011]